LQAIYGQNLANIKKNIIRVEITYKTKWMVGSMQYTLHVFSIGKLSTIAKARLMFRKKTSHSVYLNNC